MKTREKIGNGTLLVTDGKLKYIEFECLNEYNDRLVHCMSTRIGGVSEGECGSLNLGFNRKDKRENVIRNFQLLCESVGFEENSLVLTNQVHNDIVRKVDIKDLGKGYLRESDIIGVDGLMTQENGVTMVTFHADCVPVFLYEPGIHAAALLHSGWRGTLKGITGEALKKMAQLPGFCYDRLVAVIGPSIAGCCFEVGEEVYQLFFSKYGNERFYRQLPDGKHKIDLPEILRSDLLKFGLEDRNIHISGICTKCRKDLFFSYRGDAGRTGSLAAFMQLKRTADRSNL